jgi:hypothetical protein
LVFQLTWEIQSQTTDPGIWVQDATDRWHRSIDFDGYDHGLACGVTLTNHDTVQNIQMNTEIPPDSRIAVCDPCTEYWMRGIDPTGGPDG